MVALIADSYKAEMVLTKKLQRKELNLWYPPKIMVHVPTIFMQKMPLQTNMLHMHT